MAGKRFKIDPDPPVAGKPLKITYIGPASTILVQIDSRQAVRLKPDDEGRVSISRLASGDELMLSDQDSIEGYLHRRITHLG